MILSTMRSAGAVQRMSHGLNQATANPDSFGDDNQDRHELLELDKQVTKYAEVFSSKELHMFKVHDKFIVKIKNFNL